MADLNRQAIIRGMMAEVDGLSYKMAAACLEAFVACTTRALSNHQTVVLSDFGKFGVRRRRARSGMHPQKHMAIQIPATSVPYFTPSPHLKRIVDGADYSN